MLSPAEMRARYERVRADVGDTVTIVAATKYVTLAEMEVLVEAGIEVVGENRAQDLEAKHAVYGDAFRWHFIGRLQSNKVKVVNRLLRARPLARFALGGGAARDSGAPPGEPLGRGVEGRDRPRFDRRLSPI